MTGSSATKAGRTTTATKLVRAGAIAVGFPVIRPLQRQHLAWGGKSRAVCEFSQQTPVFRQTFLSVKLLHESSGRSLQGVVRKLALREYGEERGSVHTRGTFLLFEVRGCIPNEKCKAKMIEEHSVALSAARQQNDWPGRLADFLPWRASIAATRRGVHEIEELGYAASLDKTARYRAQR